jgi:hypothetical protein
MKETVITPGRKKRELFVLLACTIGAFVLNVIGIIKFNTPAKELVTQIPLVLLLSLVIYALVAVLRIIAFLVSRIWIKK